MSSSFRIYIDESGDEGFAFKPHAAGSSEWFVLSAVIIRTINDALIVQSMKNGRIAFGKPPKQALHFVKLQHGHRLAWAQYIAKLPIRTISILIHKPSIREPETFKSSYRLYRYCSRLLMERVSWFCRDLYDRERVKSRLKSFFPIGSGCHIRKFGRIGIASKPIKNQPALTGTLLTQQELPQLTMISWPGFKLRTVLRRLIGKPFR